MPRGDVNIQNCGRAFCKGAVRIAWGVDEWTLPEASSSIGKSPTTLLRCAGILDLPNRARQKDAKPIARAKLLAVWKDDEKGLDVISEELGISVDAIQRRAKRFGLPKRKQGPKPVHHKPDDFVEMWVFGVGCLEIARLVGCCQYTVSRWAREAGLPLRYARLKAKTLAEYQEHKLAKLMAETARKERDAWRAAYGKGSHAAA